MSKLTPVLALGSGPVHYGLLPDAAVALWRSVSQVLTKTWADPQRRQRLRRMNGCLDKLSAALLQVSRLRAHHDELLRSAKHGCPPGVVMAFRGIEALADFEGLLLHGRAAIDRLTWFAASEFKQQSSSFRKLRSIASAAAGTSAQAASLLKFLDVAEPWMDTLLTEIYVTEPAKKPLRDLVGHKHSIAEGVETCFCIVGVSTNRALLFDCEVCLIGEGKLTPILEVSRQASQFLSYTVLNTVAVFAECGPIPLEDFGPTWSLATVARSPFLIDEPSGSPLGPNALKNIPRRTHPAGFELTYRNYRPELWSHAIKSGGE